VTEGFHEVGVQHHVRPGEVRMPEVPPGEHLWTIMLVHRLDNPGAWVSTGPESDPRDRVLGLHNLINHAGPLCMICEQPWTPELDKQPCSGDPDA